MLVLPNFELCRFAASDSFSSLISSCLHLSLRVQIMPGPCVASAPSMLAHGIDAFTVDPNRLKCLGSVSGG